MQRGFAETVEILKAEVEVKAVLTVETLLQEKNSNSPGAGDDLPYTGRPLNIDLVTFYADLLLSAGKLDKVEQMIEQELLKSPHCLPLLLRLGRLDEARGQVFNAFDLYRKISGLAASADEKAEVQASLTRASKMVDCKIRAAGDTFSLKITGNSAPLELLFNLNEQAERAEMGAAILKRLNPAVQKVLEVECGTGLISRTLKLHGFDSEGTASSMEEIMLAIGFESAEALQSDDPVQVDFFNLDFDPLVAADIDSCDVIMVLPSTLFWYTRRGPREAAALLNKLARKARHQFFYFIAAELDSAKAGFGAELKKALCPRGSGLFSQTEVIFEDQEGGCLYLLEKKKRPKPEEDSKLPAPLPPAAGKKSRRSEIVEIALETICPAGYPTGDECEDDPTALLLKKYGYLPEAFPCGYIRGFFEEQGPLKRFLVTDGKKRLAAATKQGLHKIKCRIDHDYITKSNQ